VAAVAVLLVVAVIGLRARGTFARGPNQAVAGVSSTAAAIILSAAEGIAVIAFLIVLASARPQRKPKRDDEEEPWRPNIPWWAKTIGVLLAVAALVTPFAVLLTRKPRILGPRPRRGGAPTAGLGHATAPPPGSIWPLITGVGIAIAVVVTLTLLARRRRPAPTSPNRSRLARLAGSLAAGSDALAAGGEPRAAIIACYAGWSAAWPPPGPPRRRAPPTLRPRCWPGPPGPAWSGRSPPRR
jgi:hypothetical protein